MLLQDQSTASTSTFLQHPSLDTSDIHIPHLSPRDLKVRNNNHHHRRTLSSIHTQGGRDPESRTSSLQKLWAEDYYDSEDTSDGGNPNTQTNTFLDPIHHTPSIHPSAKVNIPFADDLQEQSLPHRTLRTHQRSLTALLPFRNPSKSPHRPSSSSSRTVDSFMPTLTGDSDGVINVADRSKGGIASWFTGTSATVPVGVPTFSPTAATQLSPSASIMPLQYSTPDRGKTKKSTLQAPEPPTITTITPTRNTQSTPTTASRFGSFFSPKAPTRTVQIPASQAESDPLLCDLLSVLYPPSSSDDDTFSPAAYKNLQMNAEGTILRLQTAYKIQLAAVHSLTSELFTVREEHEETTLKAQCLQGKISAMLLQDAEKTAQIEEQDLVISKLMEDLVLEKQVRAAEKETREKSIALLKSQAQDQSRREQSRSSTSTDEDLGFEDARRNRDSRDSEMTVESDLDSCADSVFSESRSPTRATTSSSFPSSDSLSTLEMADVQIQHASLARVVPNPHLHPTANTPVFLPRPKATPQKSTFQKLLGGYGGGEVSGEEMGVREGDAYEEIGMSGEGCANCRGKEASVAWDAVGLMRAENRGLKERIGVLEGSVEEVLGMIR